MVESTKKGQKSSKYLRLIFRVVYTPYLQMLSSDRINRMQSHKNVKICKKLPYHF